jgi:hypothetical protein
MMTSPSGSGHSYGSGHLVFKSRQPIRVKKMGVVRRVIWHILAASIFGS